MNASYRGSIDMLLHTAIMAHPVISGITPSLPEANPSVMACVKKYLAIYRDFIRPFMGQAKVYHHTPVINGVDGEGWCALEYVAPCKGRAVAAVFRLIHAKEDVYQLRFRGLDMGAKYRVCIEPLGESFVAEGSELARQGLDIRLDIALSSQLIMLERE